VIRPPAGWELPDLRELWDYRDLVLFLVRRDLAVRYRQTLLGVAWAVVQPVGFALVLSLFLGFVLDAPSAGVPRPAFVLTGLTLWLFFTQAVSRASDSTVGSASLISKVYFPRMVMPLSAVVAPAVDFLVAFAVLILVLLGYGVPLDWHVVLVPAAFLLTLALAVGAGLWLSALVVAYRDIRLAIPFLIQLGLFATPVIYPLSAIPDRFEALYSLNPMVGATELFRWALLPGAETPGSLVLVPVLAALLLLVTGALVFTRAQRTFADVI